MPIMPEFEAPDATREDVGARLARLERARRAAMAPEVAPAAQPANAAAQPASAAASSDADTVDRPPATDRLRAAVRSPWAAAAAGAALVLAGALIVPAVSAAATDADIDAVSAIATAYVDAIEQGDAESANALFLPSEDLASTALLVDAGIPDDIELEIDEIVVEGDRAAAFVSVGTLGGSTEASIDLRRGDDGWTIVAGLLAVGWSPPGIEVRVDGMQIDDGSSDRRYWLYPGTHVLESGAGSTGSVSEQVTALPGDPDIWLASSELDASAYFGEAQDAAVQFVEACIDRVVDGCPPLGGLDADAVVAAISTSGVAPLANDRLALWVTVEAEDADSRTEASLQVTLGVDGGVVVEHIVWNQDSTFVVDVDEDAS